MRLRSAGSAPGAQYAKGARLGATPFHHLANRSLTPPRPAISRRAQRRSFPFKEKRNAAICLRLAPND